MQGQRSSHTFAVAVVLAVAAVAGAVAITAIWANDQLLDTRAWVSTSDRMLQSREVRHRVSGFLAEELLDETEGQLAAIGDAELSEGVLPRLRREAPRLAERIVASPRFGGVWREANRIGHRALLRILDEETSARQGGGRLVINLTPALVDLADSIEAGQLAAYVEGDLGDYVEPGAARIEVLEAGELERAQDLVRGIRRIPVPAVVATLALFALALLLGRANLPRTTLMIGLSLALAGAFALIARVVAGNEIVDGLLRAEPDREAAEAAWRIATSTVVDLGSAAIALGLLLALFGFLCGDTGTAWALRERLGLTLQRPAAALAAAAVLAFGFVVVVVWQPLAAFGTPLGVAAFAATLAGGAAFLARSSLRPHRSSAAFGAV